MTFRQWLASQHPDAIKLRAVIEMDASIYSALRRAFDAGRQCERGSLAETFISTPLGMEPRS